MTWPRTPYITQQASVLWVSYLSLPSAGFRVAPSHPAQNRFNLRNILKPQRSLCILYRNFLPYHHFEGPQEKEPPHKSQSTNKAAGRIASSMVSPTSTRALPRLAASSFSLPGESSSWYWLHLAKLWTPCMSPSRSSPIWEGWLQMLLTWFLNKSRDYQVPMECAHSCLNVNLGWRETPPSLILTPEPGPCCHHLRQRHFQNRMEAGANPFLLPTTFRGFPLTSWKSVSRVWKVQFPYTVDCRERGWLGEH